MKQILTMAVCLLAVISVSAQTDTTGNAPAKKTTMTRQERKFKEAEMKHETELAQIRKDSANAVKLAEENAKIAIANAEANAKAEVEKAKAEIAKATAPVSENQKKDWAIVTTSTEKSPAAIALEKHEDDNATSLGKTQARNSGVLVGGGIVGGGNYNSNDIQGLQNYNDIGVSVVFVNGKRLYASPGKLFYKYWLGSSSYQYIER